MLFPDDEGTKIAFSVRPAFSFSADGRIIRRKNKKTDFAASGGGSMNPFYEERKEKLFIGGMTRYIFPAHVHNMAELVVLTRGTAVVGIDDVRYRLSPGDAAVVFPLVPHSYDELSPDSAGITAIFPPDIIPEYEGTFHGLQPELPVLPAAGSGPGLSLAVRQLEKLDMKDDLPLCVAYLHVLLACILHRLTYRPVYNYSGQDLGYRIICYISEHAYEDITLESASRALGISASHLSHFFSEKMHTNFRHFINAIRINRARLMMRSPNLDLTWISDACGFTNMRTFRRAFLREVGCLPSEHLAALRSQVPGKNSGQTPAVGNLTGHDFQFPSAEIILPPGEPPRHGR